MNFNKKYIHTFQVRTLKSLGFETRIVLCNNTQSRPESAVDFRVIAEVLEWDSEAKTTRKLSEMDFGLLKRGEKKTIEIQDLIESKNDLPVIFYMVPETLYNVAEEVISIDRDLLWFYMTAQDHYVEYYVKDQFATGVLYQCGAFNYSPFSAECNTLIQAPKFYVSEEVNSYLSIVYTYFSDQKLPRENAKVQFKLVGENGFEFVWKSEIAPFSPYLLNLKEVLGKAHKSLPAAGKMDFYCLYSLCENATLLPLVFNHNEKTGALAVEHSLPPIYYGVKIRGNSRKKTLTSLVQTGFFSEKNNVTAR